MSTTVWIQLHISMGISGLFKTVNIVYWPWSRNCLITEAISGIFPTSSQKMTGGSENFLIGYIRPGKHDKIEYTNES